MLKENAQDIKKDSDDRVPYIATNSIQESIYVKRLCIEAKYGMDEVWSYDNDNLYPQKALATCDRSWALDTATKSLSDFIRGDGWMDENLNDLVLNSEELTGFYLLKQLADTKSKLGFAIQVNYNINLEVSEINYIDFENLRVRFKDNRLSWRSDWTKKIYNDEVMYDRFTKDPDQTRKQIEEAGGIENWNGQVLYWTGTGTTNIYPKATFDAVFDDGQYQAEQKLDSLRNIQNGFSLNGAFVYPKTAQTTDESNEASKKLKQEASGPNNSGRLVMLAVPAGLDGVEKMTNFIPFERQNIDNLYVNQNQGAFQSIFSDFRQPLILNSISESGVFNQEQYNDALVFYNSITELERKEIEDALKPVFDISIWANEIKTYEIKPKPILKVDEETIEVVEPEVVPLKPEENGIE